MAIIAHHYMSNFASKESLIEWLSKYHVYTPYQKHVDMCWSAFQKHEGESIDHKLDYFMQITKGVSTKFCLSIKRNVRPTQRAADGATPWACSVCLENNRAEWSVCHSCGTPRR